MGTRIGVIIAAYNGAAFLPATLEGVLAQAHVDLECIVVDDGSRDDTARVAAAFAARDPRVRVLTQANAGAPAAYNRGLRETGGTELVALLDQDDVWEPGALAALASRLSAEPAAVAAHGLARFIDAGGRPAAPPPFAADMLDRWTVVAGRARRVPGAPLTTLSTLLIANCIATPGAALLRRDALTRAGGLDPERYIADWDLWLRLAAIGPFAFVGEPVIAYRVHGSGMSAREGPMRREADLVWRRAMARAAAEPAHAATVRAVWRFTEARLARRRLAWARDALARGRVLEAARQLRHAAASAVGKLAPARGLRGLTDGPVA